MSASPAGKLHVPVLRAFASYSLELERLISTAESGRDPEIAPHLDGEASRRLRAAVNIADLRALGAFFTGEALASELVSTLPSDVQRIVDPACGCGDLLLAASSRLPVSGSLQDTLRTWNDHLTGRDLVPEFVKTTRARLALAAMTRGAAAGPAAAQATALLTNIEVGDGLELSLRATDGVVLNPPYGKVEAPKSCRWTSGSTTAAGLFFDAVLSRAPGDTAIAAVLPEVLRCGERYGRFRAAVDAVCEVRSTRSVGRFDALTDVHVFLIAGRRRAIPLAAQRSIRWTAQPSATTLSASCEVSVGAVVAYRDPEVGPLRLYLDTKNRGDGASVSPVEKRRFLGRVFEPPFVVVPRTSRPEQRESRGIRATIVQANEAVAVENHLIVVRPTAGTVEACRAAVAAISSRAASQFLNERLLGRHLTVAALRDIPV